MSDKDSSRATRFRHRKARAGFKTISVTISPEAAAALDVLCAQSGWPQWRAVSEALIRLQAGGGPVVAAEGVPGPDSARETTELLGMKRLLAEFQGRLAELEGRLETTPSAGAQAPPAGESVFSRDEFGLTPLDRDRLLAFATDAFRKHGHAISKTLTFHMARRDGLATPADEESFGRFLQIHLAEIKRRLREAEVAAGDASARNRSPS